MKKIFTLLVLMLTAIAVNAEDYPIEIKGVKVTDANKSDVLGDGTVRYQNSNNMLIFTNANISTTSEAVYVGKEMTSTLEMKFVGNNTFTSTNGHAIYYNGSGKLTIWSNATSKGQLTINAKVSGKVGIDIANKANLRFHAIDVTVNAGSTGIGTHLTPTTEEIEIEGANLTVTGGVSAFKAKKINLIDCKYVNNYGIDGFNSDGRGTRGGEVAKEVKVKLDEYNVFVAGVQVNVNNKSNILAGDSKNNNKVSFNPAKFELTLDGADITTNNNTGIFVNEGLTASDKALKIKLIGDNKLTHTGGSCALYLAPYPESVDSVLIYSTDGGSLTCSSTNQYGTLYSTTKTAFKNCTVNLTSNHASAPAILGDNATDKTVLSFVEANINAKANGNVVKYIHYPKYYGCFMKTPAEAFIVSGGIFSNDSKEFVVVKGKDNINPFLYYGKTLSVNENGLNSAKIKFGRAMDNCTSSEKIKYHVFLQEGTTLLGKWTQSYDLDMAINSSVLYTTLTNLKEGTTYTLRMRAMDKDGNYTFYDDLVFTTATNQAPTVADKTIKFTAKARSIELSWNAATDDFTPQDQLLYTVEYRKKSDTGWFMPEVDNATSYTIENLTPNTTYVIDIKVRDNAEKPYQYMRYGEIEVTTEIEKYYVAICGTYLTSENLSSYEGQGVKYDPATNVITLDNANLTHNVDGEPTINCGLDSYTIDLKGNNTINGSSFAIAAALGNLTITSTSGDGVLNCSSSQTNSATIVAFGAITIKDCAVEIYNNNGYGLSGANASTLVINNADVKAYGKEGCICDWANFTLTNCYVDSPRPAAIGGTNDDKNMGIYKDGEVVKGTFVEIKKGVDAINAIASDAKFDGKVYNLQGVQVDENYKGIVIKNGKKFMQK